MVCYNNTSLRPITIIVADFYFDFQTEFQTQQRGSKPLLRPNFEMLSQMFRGALHSLEKAYESFSEQKDLCGSLMDFSRKQKDFCERCTRFWE